MVVLLCADQSELLESILIKEYEGSENLLLGELQFSYIAFLVGTDKSKNSTIAYIVRFF